MKQSIEYKSIPNTKLNYGYYRSADSIIVMAKEDKHAVTDSGNPSVITESDKPLVVKYYLISEQNLGKQGDYEVINQEAAEKLITGLTQLFEVPEAVKSEAIHKAEQPKSSPVVQPAICTPLRPGFFEKSTQTDSKGYSDSFKKFGNDVVEKVKKLDKKQVGMIGGVLALAGCALFAIHRYATVPSSLSSDNSLKLKK